jgi:RNA polymerase sigma-70 factor, ECF subfamily
MVDFQGSLGAGAPLLPCCCHGAIPASMMQVSEERLGIASFAEHRGRGIEACIPALRRYAGTLLRDRQDVDDLVHDCLVRALERIDTHREDENLRAWLFAIMHNLFISKMRRSKAREAVRLVVDAEEDSLILDPIQDVHVEAGDLLRAVENLPEQQRSVLVLVVLEDMSYSQVADILGIPIGTVMSRLARARERFATSTRTSVSPSPSPLRIVK